MFIGNTIDDRKSERSSQIFPVLTPKQIQSLLSVFQTEFSGLSGKYRFLLVLVGGMLVVSGLPKEQTKEFVKNLSRMPDLITSPPYCFWLYFIIVRPVFSRYTQSCHCESLNRVLVLDGFPTLFNNPCKTQSIL